MDLATSSERPDRGPGVLRSVAAALAALTALVGLSGPASAAPTVTGVAVTDPAFSAYEQGTLDSGTGAERNGASDVATRIRLSDQVPVDPSWQAVQLSGRSDIQVTVFAYDASGRFLAPSSGWKGLASPYTFTLPAGTATIDYAVSYTTSANISTTDRATWVTVAGVLAPDTSPTAVTDSSFYALESGTIASATGKDGSDPTRLRLGTPAAVDPSWASLQLAQAVGDPDLDVTVFAYDASGAYLTPSTGWQSLASGPYVYAIPAGTASIRYVVKYHVGGTIAPTDHAAWLTVAVAGTRDIGTTPPATTDPVTPVPFDDPAWDTYEQGTLASADGTERNGASDVATRIRLRDAVALDPSVQAVELDAGDHGAGLSITVFAYDANGRFISPSSGWKSLASPYVYQVPTGAVKLDWALTHDTSAVQPISVGEEAHWLTLSSVQVDPRDDYVLNTQPITPEITIPGFTASQGGNFVNGKLWLASASDDGNVVANGKVRVYSVDYAHRTTTLVHTFSHNFGHLNSFSYDEPSGQLIFGNGSSSYTQAPAFFVLKVANLDLDGTNTLDSAHATTFDVPADFGAKCNVIWTETPNEAVMLTDDGITVRRIRLATGTTRGRYGDYAAAAAADYNGTFDVLSTYQINTAYDVVQSAAWVDGKLVIGLGHGPMSVAVIDLTDAPHMDYEVYRDASDSGYFEPVFHDPDNHYFGGVDVANGQGWFWDDTNLTFSSTPPAPTVTGVTVEPSSTTLAQGATHAFDAVVEGDGHPAQTVTWAVSGNASTRTGIDGSGLLTVADDETSSALTVTATSTADPTKQATATVAVTSAPPALAFVTPSASATVSGTVGVAVSLSGTNLRAYNLRVDSSGLQYAYRPGAGTLTFALDTTTLSNGVHTLLATATNTAGAKTTITETITVDNPILPAAWAAQSVYTAGDQVAYQGTVWQALWWTQNQVPGDPYGPWEQIVTGPDETAAWTATRVFTAGDEATYQGRLYEAQWYTRNQVPGVVGGPWKQVG